MEKDDSILKFQRPGTNFHTDNSRPIITVDPRLCPLPETLVDSRMVLLVYCEREAVGMERDCRRRKEREANEGQRRQGEREQTNTHTTLDAILQPTITQERTFAQKRTFAQEVLTTVDQLFYFDLHCLFSHFITPSAYLR